jgi:hypothetical protein
VRPTVVDPNAPDRVAAAAPLLVRVVRVVAPVALLVYLFVLAHWSPRWTWVLPQLPYTFEPWRVWP